MKTFPEGFPIVLGFGICFTLDLFRHHYFIAGCAQSALVLYASYYYACYLWRRLKEKWNSVPT
ncbi:hypothetical protein KGO95_04115 [Patescibacteria group bacterium]|nr:hypothetical protein [Patescibacteria group bacterium]